MKSVIKYSINTLKSVIMDILYRKIRKKIRDHLLNEGGPVLIVDGARQIGKTYTIRDVGKEIFTNFIELNMEMDYSGPRLYENVRTIDDFYFQTSSVFGQQMREKENTLIFIDEIQRYPHLITLLKFLKDDNKYTYVASGSLLGVTLSQTTSIPLGSIQILQMYPLDFEEFLIANGIGEYAIEGMRNHFLQRESLEENTHKRMMDMFRKYLLVGGLPEAVKSYVNHKNINEIRDIQNQIYLGYGIDASKYDIEHKLKIKRIYDLMASYLNHTKKRVVYNQIENKTNQRFQYYLEEFDYLIHAGIAVEVKAISNPVFPLIQSEEKNLLKLYYNDVGIFTGILYHNNISAVLEDDNSINLGSVYENVVATELKTHGKKLFYYDNRKNGEVDFIIDNYADLSVLPIEVKSGKDYTVHSALNKLTKNEDYPIKEALVLSNEREVKEKGKILYLPIYYVMFL